ncbi:MAG: DNA topoisomerase (ATP-hydrolyzing) subunit B [Candidatus Pacearchaeota archaeon]
MQEEKNKKNYTADDIKVLDGLEGVRKRPAMYIGSTGKEGLHHLVYEIVDNSVDEALAGFCNKIIVILEKDGSVIVEDNGRGIPVEKHKQTGKSTVETVMTILHAGGKFEHKAYIISGGLHGVGASVVNALCKKFIVTVKRDGKIWQQEFSRGKPKTELKIVGKSKDEKETGTIIQFWPDEEIFSTLNFDYSLLLNRLREIAFLTPGLKIILKDEIKNRKEELLFEGGLIEFVKWLNRGKEVLHKPIYFKKQTDDTIIEVAIQYNASYNDNIYGFVNTINTIEGGTHIVGFKTALTRVINNYATKNKIIKTETITGDDTKEGLTAVISLRIKDPQFEGQTKTKLGNSEIKGFVDSVVTSFLNQFFEENPSIAKKITEKVAQASKAREAAKKARDLVRRKNAFNVSGLPGKLADCSSNKVEETELFIVEGESAGGSSKMGRNKEFQAILPLKGKILNVEKAQPIKVLSNEEIANLITAIGTGIGDEFNIEKLRYGKIIIMTDADVDGQHIKTLLLTFFYRYMPQLIENGKIYVAVPPLYKVRKDKDYYIYSDKELKILLDKIQSKNVNVQRFKGLGEMNPQQLWETTMNPKTRILRRITIEDAIEANETISVLMGDDVQPRKEFIEEHAKEANLDL